MSPYVLQQHETARAYVASGTRMGDSRATARASTGSRVLDLAANPRLSFGSSVCSQSIEIVYTATSWLLIRVLMGVWGLWAKRTLNEEGCSPIWYCASAPLLLGVGVELLRFTTRKGCRYGCLVVVFIEWIL